jgi:hypothetical protein
VEYIYIITITVPDQEAKNTIRKSIEIITGVNVTVIYYSLRPFFPTGEGEVDASLLGAVLDLQSFATIPGETSLLRSWWRLGL